MRMQKIVVILMTVSLMSCTTAGVVATGIIGGVAAGYYVGKDERTLEEIADDVSITAAVKSKFVADKSVSALNINVDTFMGVVTLYGSTKSKAIESHAMQLAAQVKGVQKVVSKMTVLSES